MLNLFDRFVQSLTWRTAQVAQIALFFSMAIIVANVIARIPWKPVPGTVEIVEMSGAVLLGLGVAYTAIMKGHIAVGVLVDTLPPRIQALVDTFVSAVSLFFTSILAWQIYNYALTSSQRGYTTGFLYIPLAPSIYLVAFGMFMVALVLFRDLLKALVALVKGGESG